MRLLVLHIDECPNWLDARDRLQEALVVLELSGVEIECQLLTSTSEAAAVPFAGSPTILINGLDAFPSEGRTSDLACRVYQTEVGLAGVPSLAQLVEAIGQHV